MVNGIIFKGSRVVIPKSMQQSILRSDTRHKSCLSHVNDFHTPLWRTIKNSGRAGSGREDRLETIITK